MAAARRRGATATPRTSALRVRSPQPRVVMCGPLGSASARAAELTATPSVHTSPYVLTRRAPDYRADPPLAHPPRAGRQARTDTAGPTLPAASCALTEKVYFFPAVRPVTELLVMDAPTRATTVVPR